MSKIYRLALIFLLVIVCTHLFHSWYQGLRTVKGLKMVQFQLKAKENEEVADGTIQQKKKKSLLLNKIFLKKTPSVVKEDAPPSKVDHSSSSSLRSPQQKKRNPPVPAVTKSSSSSSSLEPFIQTAKAIDEKSIKLPKETKYQDFNYVNLNRVFGGEKKNKPIPSSSSSSSSPPSSPSSFQQSNNRQLSRPQQQQQPSQEYKKPRNWNDSVNEEDDNGDEIDEVQQFLKETNEEVEDLTTPENLQFFQPEFDPKYSKETVGEVTSHEGEREEVEEEVPEAAGQVSLPSQPVNQSVGTFKSGFVSIIGNPNVGKSTLMNFLLKQKLSIVSSKPQTTRHKIFGILTEEKQYQIVFMDTPGMLYQNKAAYTLHETMQSVIRYAAMDTDVLLLITDVFSDELQDEKIMERLQRAPFPVIVVINKIDLFPDIATLIKTSSKELQQRYRYEQFNATLPKLIQPNIPLTRAKLNDTITLEIVTEKWKTRLPKADIIPVSAAYSLGVNDLLTKILSYLKPGPKYYPSDYVSDKDERFFTSEIIRESIFEIFDGEIPYCCEVFIENFKDFNPTFSKIIATIFVNRKSQVNIVVGKDGNKIKELGIISREKLEKFLERKIHLELQVKNDPDWRSKKESLKKFGYIEDE